jgi:hypothetical protein
VRPPISQKYLGESNPNLWLVDYQLACHARGADHDNFIICNLLLYLVDSAWAWLENLRPGCIQNWPDLKEIFVGNFQGMCVRLGHPWDLKNCQQKPVETLRNYIRRFSQ